MFSLWNVLCRPFWINKIKIMKFHTYKWNKRDKEYTMLILTEEDIENESNNYVGAGYEILILPYKNI